MREKTRAARLVVGQALSVIFLVLGSPLFPVSLSLAQGPTAAALGGVALVAPADRPPAPDFTLPDLNGKSKSLHDYRGKVVLVTFWASWCLPCREEMPTIREAYERHRAAGFEVVGISIDARPADAAAFVAEFRIPFDNLLDGDVRVGRQYRALGVPTSFLLDRSGRIAYRVVGPRDWTDAASLEAISKLLRGP